VAIKMGFMRQDPELDLDGLKERVRLIKEDTRRIVILVQHNAEEVRQQIKAVMGHPVADPQANRTHGRDI